MADIISFKDWVKKQEKTQAKRKFTRALLKPHKVVVKGRPSKFKRLLVVKSDADR
jgi:hypothetical protein